MPPPTALAQQFLLECSSVYQTGDQSEDLPSFQPISAYLAADAQLKYSHMYFAKSVGLWRELRQLPGLGSGPVVSIGAGPCLCLFGWFWDSPPAATQQVMAVDALDWRHVRALPGHRALAGTLLGSGFQYFDGRHVPDGVAPPQVSGAAQTAPFLVPWVPPGSTVLAPFLMNHMLGASSPTPNPADVFRWLHDVGQRAQDVLIVDMPCDVAGGLWSTLGAGVRAAGQPRVLAIASAPQLAGMYPNRASWTWRRGSTAMSRYTALRSHQGAWSFV